MTLTEFKKNVGTDRTIKQSNARNCKGGMRFESTNYWAYLGQCAELEHYGRAYVTGRHGSTWCIDW